MIPLGKGSVLIAVGDVSGKGVPAAMTVSLLVGNIVAQAAMERNGPQGSFAGHRP